jgi:hypothetical protein
MSKHETTRAYARARREWPGLVVKNYTPRHRGYPDLTLVHGRVVFAEVKWLARPDATPALAPLQLDWLNRLASHGAFALALGAHAAGWRAWRAPLPHSFSQASVNGRCLLPPWWAGASLAELAGFISSGVTPR